MMKGKWAAVLLALSFLLVLGPARAVPAPEVVFHGIPHQDLFDVAFEGARGFAVGMKGTHGEILTTGDGGKTWTVEKSPATEALLGIAVKGKLAVAVGQMGTILVKNGGGPWTLVPVKTRQRLMAVAIHGSVVVAVGSFGTMLRSTDDGRTWSKIGPDWPPMYKPFQDVLGLGFNPHLYVCKFDGNGNLFVAGEVGTIVESRDDGQTWTVVHKGVANDNGISPSVFGLSINGKGVGVAVGQNGSILRTTDDGATWAPVKSGTPAILLGALVRDNGQILVTGMYSMLWSTDGGQTWQQVEGKGGTILSTWYSDVAGNSDTIGDIVVGQGATILNVKP